MVQFKKREGLKIKITAILKVRIVVRTKCVYHKMLIFILKQTQQQHGDSTERGTRGTALGRPVSTYGRDVPHGEDRRLQLGHPVGHCHASALLLPSAEPQEPRR